METVDTSQKPMILMLAENYYAVAAHLRQQICRLTETADMLEQMADQMCERNIRQQSSAGDEHGR